MDQENRVDNAIPSAASTERNSSRWIVYVLVIAVIVAIGGYVANEEIGMPVNTAQSAGPPTGVGPNVRMIAPDFALKDLQGNDVRLSDLRGKTVMINFWATWCPPCRYEMPYIEAVYREKAGEDFVVLAVSIDDDPDAVVQFVKEFGLTFPVLIDTDKRVSYQYRVRPIPTTFFVDKEGVIRDVQIGAMDKKTLLKKLSKIM